MRRRIEARVLVMCLSGALWPAAALLRVEAASTQSPEAAQPAKALQSSPAAAFYVWTAEIPELGRILRTEPLPADLALGAPNRAQRLLYSSTDGITNSRRPIAVSGALFYPDGNKPKGGWPLVVWAHGTVGTAAICAPSFRSRSERDSQYIRFWLSQGYAVIAPDYQGLGVSGPHPWFATRPVAYGILDSIRAAIRDLPDLRGDAVIVGGTNAVSAAVFQRIYAPELPIRGIFAAGVSYFDTPPGEVSQFVHTTLGPSDAPGPGAAYALLALTGAEQREPTLHLNALVSDTGAKALELARTACAPELLSVVQKTGLTRESAFRRDITPELSALEPLYRLPAVAIAAPLMIATGGRDVVAPPAMQRRLAAAVCRTGGHVDMRVYDNEPQNTVLIVSQPDAAAFVAARFANRPFQNKCEHIQN